MKYEHRIGIVKCEAYNMNIEYMQPNINPKNKRKTTNCQI